MCTRKPQHLRRATEAHEQKRESNLKHGSTSRHHDAKIGHTYDPPSLALVACGTRPGLEMRSQQSKSSTLVTAVIVRGDDRRFEQTMGCFEVHSYVGWPENREEEMMTRSE